MSRFLQSLPGFFVFWMAIALSWGDVLAQVGQDALLARGKSIYQNGGGEDSGITAQLGKEGIPVSAALLPCINCHGAHGKGRPEGGVEPPDITWQNITKSYGARFSNGRQRQAYSETQLKRAITMGIDSSGNRLDAAMPRYQMTHEDMRALIHYLRQLHQDRDSGIGAKTVRLGILLPPGGKDKPLGGELHKAINGYLDLINREGGVYGRQLAGHFLALPAEISQRADAVRRFVNARDLFVLMASYLVDAEQEISTVCEELEIPLIGAYSLDPPEQAGLSPMVFYLNEGFTGQVRDLFHFAKKHSTAEKPQALLVHNQHRFMNRALEKLKTFGAASGWDTRVLRIDAIEKMAAYRGNQTVFWLVFDDGAGIAAFLQAASQVGWYPRVFLPGTLGDQRMFAAPAGFDRKLYLAFSNLPADLTPAGSRVYAQLLAEKGLNPAHQSLHMELLTSLKLVLDGLKAGGKRASRTKMVAFLEKCYRHPGEYMAPLTFSANRRIGSEGAHILSLDLQQQAWVSERGKPGGPAAERVGVGSLQ